MDVLIEAPLSLPGEAPTDRKNKWRSYRDGKHTPSRALVAAIDRAHPGGAAFLSHPVWQLLRLDRPTQDQIPDVLCRLPPALYAVFKGSKVTAYEPLALTQGWNSRRLRQLERHVGFEGLACTIALLRLAIDKKDIAQAFEFSRTLCRMLLMMGPWLSAHGIALPLTTYVEQTLLPIAAYEGKQQSFGNLGFLPASKQLFDVAKALEARDNMRLTWLQRVDLLLDLMDDKFTLELSTLVVPIDSPCVTRDGVATAR